MKDSQNYDETYKKALRTNDPSAFINKRWGDPKPYFNEFIKPLIKKNMNVVEIGSGFGRYTNLILPNCDILYGIEPSSVCRNFLSKNKKIKMLSPDALDKIPNNSIDLTFSFSTMLHFNLYEIWWYIKSCTNKLKNNGYLIIHYSSFESGGIEIFTRRNIKKFGETDIYCFHHSSQIKELANTLKLKVICDKSPKQLLVKGHRIITLRKEK